MRVAIIGGAGPAASAHLHVRTIETAQARGAVADADFPDLLVVSAPVHGISHLGELDRQGTTVAGLAQNLTVARAAGATHAVVACNTVQPLVRRLVVDRPDAFPAVVDLGTACARACADAGFSSVTLLTSRAARAALIYEDDLRAAGVVPLRVSDAQQTVLDHLILGVMGGVREPGGFAHLAAQFDGPVLVACSELSVMAAPDAVVVDASDVAAAALCDLFYTSGPFAKPVPLMGVSDAARP